jgi:hypothetical protein
MTTCSRRAASNYTVAFLLIRLVEISRVEQRVLEANRVEDREDLQQLENEHGRRRRQLSEV